MGGLTRVFNAGYTIVEIMIVLGISGVIFVSGWALFAGQGAETGFNQAMSDVASEITTRAKEVASSSLANYQGYSCSLAGSPPRTVLSPSSGSSTTGNQDCLALGKAFEAIPGTADIYIYGILGNRQFYINGVPSGLPTNLSQANPTTASAAGTDLTDNYKLGAGAQIVSSKVSSGATESTSSLIGFYLGFNGEDSADQSGSLSVAPVSYNFQPSAHDTAAAKACIEGSTCAAPSQINHWKVCFKSSDSRQTAELDVAITAAGTTTNVKYESCS